MDGDLLQLEAIKALNAAVVSHICSIIQSVDLESLISNRLEAVDFEPEK